MSSFSILPLEKAASKFIDFKKHLKSDQEKAGAVQAFEYTFELSWKMLKKALSSKGIEAFSQKDVLRQSALVGFIGDVEVWFDLLKKRNLTVHTYNEDTIDSIILSFDLFEEKVIDLIESLKHID